MGEERSYNFKDPVVAKVVDKFTERSSVGFEKYGTTLDQERKQGLKGVFEYLNDVQEELMDAILYIQSVKDEVEDLSRSALVKGLMEDNKNESDGKA